MIENYDNFKDIEENILLAFRWIYFKHFVITNKIGRHTNLLRKILFTTKWDTICINESIKIRFLKKILFLLKISTFQYKLFFYGENILNQRRTIFNWALRRQIERLLVKMLLVLNQFFLTRNSKS
jgi:hypothetical protein